LPGKTMKAGLKVSLAGLPKEPVAYALAFLVPSLIRWFPQSMYPFPIGYDTPWYLYMTSHFNPLSYARTFEYILGLLASAGLDPFILMMYLPAVTHGLLGAALFYFIRTHLHWTTGKSLFAALLTTASSVALRVSWDLHSQSLGMVFFLLTLGSCESARRLRDYVVTSVLAIMTAASHQLLAVLLAALLISQCLLKLYRRNGRTLELRNAFFLLLSGALVCAFLLLAVYRGDLAALLDRGFRSYLSPEHELLSYEWYRLVDPYLSLYVLAYGLVFLVAVLGFFSDDLLTAWTIVAGVAALSIILWPYYCVNLPDRWSYLLYVPMYAYASNAISTAWNGLAAIRVRPAVKSLAISCALLVPTVSMLNPAGPLSLLDRTYDMFPSRMSSSTVVSASVLSDAIDAVHWLSDMTDRGVLFVPDYFLYWSAYSSHLEVRRFSGPTDAAVKRAMESGNDVYILWWGGAESLGFDPLFFSGPFRVYRARG